jgi:hypothetical protein
MMMGNASRSYMQKMGLVGKNIDTPANDHILDKSA